MNCEELRPEYLPYVLGTLTEPERSQIREHLSRGCANCAAGLSEARSMAFALGAAVDGPEPSRHLRGRVLALASGNKKAKFSWFTALVTASATAVVVAGLAATIFNNQARITSARVSELRSAMERSGADAAAMREAMSLIQAPETREVSFGEGKPAPARGRVFAHPGGVLLIASRLPVPPVGKTYEMWIIRDGNPVPAGLFASDHQGNAFHLFRPRFAPMAKDVVAVTLEASAGANLPTTTPIIVAQL